LSEGGEYPNPKCKSELQERDRRKRVASKGKKKIEVETNIHTWGETQGRGKMMKGYATDQTTVHGFTYSVVLRADRKENLLNMLIDTGKASLRIRGGIIASRCQAPTSALSKAPSSDSPNHKLTWGRDIQPSPRH